MASSSAAHDVFDLPKGARFVLDLGEGRVADMVVETAEPDLLVWRTALTLGLGINTCTVKLRHFKADGTTFLVQKPKNQAKNALQKNQELRALLADMSRAFEAAYTKFVGQYETGFHHTPFHPVTAEAGAVLLLDSPGKVFPLGLVVVSNEGGRTILHTEVPVSNTVVAPFKITCNHGGKKLYHTQNLHPAHAESVKKYAKDHWMAGALGVVEHDLKALLTAHTKTLASAPMPVRPQRPVRGHFEVNTWI